MNILQINYGKFLFNLKIQELLLGYLGLSLQPANPVSDMVLT